jgi:CRP/FNR family transcriptional regulator, anaerobic regulatory protein
VVFSHQTTREPRVTQLPGSRVAAFLLILSERLTALGHSPLHLALRVTGEEIASLLGMNLETVSRILSKFQEEGLIEIHGEQLRIVNIEGLRAVVGR